MRTPLLAAALLLAPVTLPGADDPVAIGHWGTMLVVTAPAGDDGRIGARLDQRLTVEWVDAPLSEVAAFLRTATGATIVLAPDVLAADPRVTLKARDMGFGNVLAWVSRQAGVHHGFTRGAIWIGREPLRGDTRTVLYDVSDLITPVRDFPGPELAFNADGAANGALLVPADAPSAAATIEDLEGLLRETVARDAR